MSDHQNFAKSVWTFPFFSQVREAEKNELLKVASFKHIRRGEMLFSQGDALTHFYIICSGVVQLFRETPDGRELTNAIQLKGDVLFDPESLLLPQKHGTHARAVENATLFAIPLNWLRQRLKSFDELALKLVVILSQRLKLTQVEIEHQETFNAMQIVACFLQHMCVLYNFDPNGFDLPYSKSLMASRLGMELESLSRALPKLRECGITVRGKHVSFNDIAAAQKISCAACTIAEECPSRQLLARMTGTQVAKQAVYAEPID